MVADRIGYAEHANAAGVRAACFCA